MEMSDELIEKVLGILVAYVEQSERTDTMIKKAIKQLKSIEKNNLHPEFHTDRAVRGVMETLGVSDEN